MLVPVGECGALCGTGQAGVRVRVDFHPVQEYRHTVLVEVQQVRARVSGLREYRGWDLRPVDRFGQSVPVDSGGEQDRRGEIRALLLFPWVSFVWGGLAGSRRG